MPETPPKILLPTLPDAAPVPEAVLFAFDGWAFPFQLYLQTSLIAGQRPRLVLPHGPPGSHDESLMFYGDVIRVGDTFHLWYCGNYGPIMAAPGGAREKFVVCYATSKDGVEWHKPELGLTEFNGSKRNNIVDLPGPMPFSTFAVIHEPNDPDPHRRFKAAYGVRGGESGAPGGGGGFCAAYSPDGLRWEPLQTKAVGPLFDVCGVTRHRGLYYMTGQAPGRQRLPIVRRLVTFVSKDFEQWSPMGAIGLDRAPMTDIYTAAVPPNSFDEVHLGAGLWNRGNVILGIYGQWRPPSGGSGDRRSVTIDLGLAISHDGLHYHEPIPGFRFVPARETPGTAPDSGMAPALMQGHGMENVGDRTLYWYSTWRALDSTGVRVTTWERDRLGIIRPFMSGARAISCPIQVVEGEANVYVNAGGLGPHSELRVGLLDEGFRDVPGFRVEESEPIRQASLRAPVRWRHGRALSSALGRVRLDIHFERTRPEDIALYAAYLSA
jgi:hypothetical protein